MVRTKLVVTNSTLMVRTKLWSEQNWWLQNYIAFSGYLCLTTQYFVDNKENLLPQEIEVGDFCQFPAKNGVLLEN
jgi:hypothetical protein